MAQFLMMDAVTAAMLRGATAGDEQRLDPRGAASGLFALPVAVLGEAAFGWLGDVLGELTVAERGPGDWPVEGEE
jgi:hypothetical protein